MFQPTQGQKAGKPYIEFRGIPLIDVDKLLSFIGTPAPGQV
jgi:hypothetical protein